MSEFALKTALPAYLREEQSRIERLAAEAGLDFFPTVFEILTYDQMNEIAAYGGFPNRYPHWRFGMEYERLAKSYEYGLSKIYEMVINNNPSYAYLLEGNSLVDQKLVMAHVYGHVDFFKNNYCFRSTDLDTGGRTVDPVRRPSGYDPNRRWIDKMANHGSRVRRVVARQGINRVEEFLDHCLSLENLVDLHSPFTGRRSKPELEDDEPKATEIPRLRAKEYMESFINPEEYLEEQKKKIEARREKSRKFPEHAERDVLLFLLEHAPLERWERELLEVTREEAYYFAPQGQTKIMNEGWACVAADTLVYTAAGLVPMAEVVEGATSIVSDGDASRHVYDRHVIRSHESIRVRTRSGLEVTGSVNHRVRLGDGVTWRRLDELRVGDVLEVTGGAGLWPAQAPRWSWRPPPPAAQGARGGGTAAVASTGPGVGREVGGISARPPMAPATPLVARAAAPLLAPMDTGAVSDKAAPSAALRIPQELDEPLAAFLGLLVGGGFVSRTQSLVALRTRDEAQFLSFELLGERLFGLRTRTVRHAGHRIEVVFRSGEIAELLIAVLGLPEGSRARCSAVPPNVLRSPESIVRSFLRAYFDCAARVGPKGIVLRGVGDALGAQVQLLLLNFGVRSTCRAIRRGGFCLRVAGRSVATFMKAVGFGLLRKQRDAEAYVARAFAFGASHGADPAAPRPAVKGCDKGGAGEPWQDAVESLTPGRCDVYDISVRETHRYAAAGFVHHNSYWHSHLMTTRILDASEIVDYADHNAGVMATSGGRLNPYKLGVELYRHVEERWDRGQFGKEWEECDDLEAKKNWNLRLGLGRKKIFEVRALYNDVTFIDEFLTPDFVREHKLFSFGWSNRNERFEIESREFRSVKDKLLFQLTNAGSPFIYVEDANFENRGELLLRHDHQGLDLRQDYAKEVMRSVFRMWKRPVSVLTIAEGKTAMLRFDGKEHTTRHIRG